MWGKGKRWIVFFLAIFLGAIYLCILLFFLLRFNDHDQIAYYSNILYSRPLLWNPHHLHFEHTGLWFHRILSHLCGHDGDHLVFHLRLRSMFFASMGLGVGFLAVYRLTGRWLFAFFFVSFVGFSHAYWLYSSKIDTAIFPTVWSLVLFYILLSNRRYSLWRAFGDGLILFIGIMLHQYFVFSAVAYGLAVLFRRGCWYRRLFYLSIASVFCIVLTAWAYYYTGIESMRLSIDRRGTSIKAIYRDFTFQEWLFFYKAKSNRKDSKDKWAIPLPASTRKLMIARGLTDAFLSPMHDVPKYNKSLRFAYGFSRPFETKRIAFWMVAGLFLIAVGGLLLLPKIFLRYPSAVVYLFSHLLFYGLLASIWEPFYVEFWIIPMVYIFLWVILIANWIVDRLRALRLSIASVPVYGWLFLGVVVLGLHNLYFHAIPHAIKAYCMGPANWMKKLDLCRRMEMRAIYKDYRDPYARTKLPLLLQKSIAIHRQKAKID